MPSVSRSALRGGDTHPHGRRDRQRDPGIQLRRQRSQADQRARRRTAPATTQAVDRHNCYGMAWSAQRATIEKCGHYDRNIVGGGDAVHVFAALSRLDQYWALRSNTQKQKLDIIAWVQAASSGLLAHIIRPRPESLLISGMRGSSRTETIMDATIFSRHGFDPAEDIRVLTIEPGDGAIGERSGTRRRCVFLIAPRRRHRFENQGVYKRRLIDHPTDTPDLCAQQQ